MLSAVCAYSRATAGSPPISPNGNKVPNCMAWLLTRCVRVGRLHASRQLRQSVDDFFRQAARAGDRHGVAALRVRNGWFRTGSDQQIQGLKALEPRGVKDRRLAMRPQIEPWIGIQELAA